MDAEQMRKTIVAANKRRQRLIRAGFTGFANVNLIQNIIDTANRINPFSKDKKRTTLNPKARGSELRRQFLAAKQIMNMEQSSVRTSKRERALLEEEVRRRATTEKKFKIDYEKMTERRVKALYNLLKDTQTKRLLELFQSSDEAASPLIEAFNRGDTVGALRVTIDQILSENQNKQQSGDKWTAEELREAFGLPKEKNVRDDEEDDDI